MSLHLNLINKNLTRLETLLKLYIMKAVNLVLGEANGNMMQQVSLSNNIIHRRIKKCLWM